MAQILTYVDFLNESEEDWYVAKDGTYYPRHGDTVEILKGVFVHIKEKYFDLEDQRDPNNVIHANLEFNDNVLKGNIFWVSVTQGANLRMNDDVHDAYVKFIKTETKMRYIKEV